MSNLSFNQILYDYGAKIERKLETFFQHRMEEASDYHGFIEDACGELRDFVMRGGKRLASCSTLLTYKGYKEEVNDEILTVCAAMETYRHAILVHDDLIDRDEMRRGEKSYHAIYKDVCMKNFPTVDPERFGEGMAVFGGNILYTLTLDLLSSSNFDVNLLKEVSNLLLKGYREVNESQILDMLFEGIQPSEKEWYIMASKRAPSLFRTTILSGAVLAEAPLGERKILSECATQVGYAFDIQDDIIGTFATEEQYGRPTTGDILLGKKPLHVIYALQASQEVAERLRKALGDKNATGEDIDFIRELIREHGLGHAKERCVEHAEKATVLINKTSLSSETKDFFTDFIGIISGSLDWYK